MKKTVFILIIVFIIANIVFIFNFKKSFKDDNIYLNNNSNQLKDFLKTIDDVLEYSLKNNINEEVKNLFDKYPDFKNILLKANIRVPIIENMIPQGIEVVDNYYLITAYDCTNKNNSICYILTKYGKLVTIIDLKNKSHVGSIEYDALNNLIFIPDLDGILNVYDKKLFMNNKVTPLYQYSNLSENLINYQNKKENEIAYLTINEGYLYLGSFSLTSNGLVKKYSFNIDEEEITFALVQEFSVPSKTQGIAFTKKENEKYMILSRSYGRNNHSLLEIYQYDKETDNYNKHLKSLVLPPMLEQISIVNDELLAIFESNALKYTQCVDKINDIIVFDLNKILFSEND